MIRKQAVRKCINAAGVLEELKGLKRKDE